MICWTIPGGAALRRRGGGLRDRARGFTATRTPLLRNVGPAVLGRVVVVLGTAGAFLPGTAFLPATAVLAAAAGAVGAFLPTAAGAFFFGAFGVFGATGVFGDAVEEGFAALFLKATAPLSMSVPAALSFTLHAAPHVILAPAWIWSRSPHSMLTPLRHVRKASSGAARRTAS